VRGRQRLAIITLLLLVAAVAVAGTAGATQAQGRSLSTTLTGAAEIPGPGDPDGAGTAALTVNPGLGQICYELTVSGIAPANAAHIHLGTVTEAGPVVVPLAAPTDGTSSGCAEVSRELALAILKSPSDYYVNVHNAEFPAGALRGQLSK
jgi:hypothetical protein